MKQHTVLRVVSKLLLPLILLFALYVQFHGDFGPGGGFQAGVIFASAVVLYALIYDLAAARRAVPVSILRWCASAGVLLYAGVGIVAMLRGGEFLNYSALAAHPQSGQHWGILLIELGVGVTVAAVMILIFYAFAGRAGVIRRQHSDANGNERNGDSG